jgi:hypothetical protein
VVSPVRFRPSPFRPKRADEGLGRRPDRAELVHERLHEVVFHQDCVCARFFDGFVNALRVVGGQRDQADVRVISAETGDRGDAVEQRHVQVDDDCIRAELVRELDRREPVRRCADDAQVRLRLDQLPEGVAERRVVVREEDSDGRLHRS